ncbi:hypothetical protein TRFO_29152 [Tritrichomonas foetus]|uniref:Uncharacterized protein n=1 Tax=Tritrichomonas foetus TaxID=1144522 RepID=A0A1J4K1Y1_9EUKA|nr:hypothetical protein TRFO_29152 [Tritrichomonas foetus]|eukprot:OHT03485.1 hypothetical protein TRFO_29152 [Tritrichomonas foetus]
MKFDFNTGLEYLCDKTNFRQCRLFEMIENNDCPAYQILIGESFVLYDLPFLILSVIVAIFFILFVSFLKEIKRKYHNQRKTRGTWYWRIHLILSGIQVLVWAISLSIVATMGDTQNSLIIIRGLFLNMAQALLFWITLVDIQLIPATGWYMHVLCALFTIVIGILWALMFSKENAAGVILMGIAVPIGCSIFHFLAMLPVVLYRKMWLGVLYLFLMAAFNIGYQVIDLFLNGPLCNASSGWFSGSSLAVLVFAFYRVVVQLFFTELKKAEKDDGLPVRKRRLSEPSSSELNKPLPVELSDYTYSYTYTDTSDDSI